MSILCYFIVTRSLSFQLVVLDNLYKIPGTQTVPNILVSLPRLILFLKYKINYENQSTNLSTNQVIIINSTGAFSIYIHKLNLIWRWLHISKSTDNTISFNWRQLWVIQSGQLTYNSVIAAKLPVPNIPGKLDTW
jgi:hypothetical protein